ncbi:SOS response-associated peptidase [Corynebacterium guangdongense]|uniref:Abasic site processing protein n=1 Tax=Corynebacterium guangdongense TaxID=1783348 RepID=A0ABU1ZUV8_9CORY|nr:SOS response-associated peptidase [Corynebacterium guangdongense]MDR7328709.1 putative SOS response-associated peptidase YedK [Corynebacterium guangdongense]
MCGRFVLFTTGDALLERVGSLPGVTEVLAPEGTPGPRYNVAPTQTVPIVRVKESLAQVDPARWGLIPHWKKDDSGPPLFNARGETVAEKPSFRDAFKRQRSLMVLDGYYEWFVPEEERGKSRPKKQPYYVRRTDGGVLWAAGLWSTGLDQLSTTMVTTESAGRIAWLHDRLPRFLAEEEIEQWLHGTPEEAAELLHPAPSSLIDAFEWSPADPAVGSVRNDHAGLIENPGLF